MQSSVIPKIASLISIVSLASIISSAQAQVSLNLLNAPSTQNFDTLSNVAGTNPWANNSTIAGWYAVANTQPTTYVASFGDGTAGAIYSYGSSGNSDRALGAQPTNGTGNFYYAVQLRNNTGSTINALDVSFVCEQWRNGGNATSQTLVLEYQVATVGAITGANTPTTGWNAVNALNCSTPVNSTSPAALDGNLPANQVSRSGTINTTVAVGDEIWIRWFDLNDSGVEHGMGIDNFSVTPKGAASSTPTLSINDVSVAEGNSGTTNFTFTVSLSAPAGAGGVTFDIATADGTATLANSDYVSRSLSSQTIAQGNSSYAFTVAVNGDTAQEPNETFFVNVTNVVGATVADGQGLGTILNDDIALIAIHDIQGAGSTSPLNGQTVTTSGIVTAVFPGFRGFYIQTPDAAVDSDDNTSQGIFVFMNSATLPPSATVGNLLQVTGVVNEFPASSGATQLGTSAATPSLVQLSSGNPLPTAVSVTLPLSSTTALERYEGMRVRFPQELTVSGNFTLGRFGEVVLSSGGRLINPSNAIDLNDNPASGTSTSGTSNVAAITAAIAANAVNQITLDDATSAQNPDPTPYGVTAANTLRAGSTISGVVGIVSQIAQGYRVLSDPSSPPTFNRAARPLTPPNVGGQIKAAGFNVLNYFNGDGTGGGFPTSRGASTAAEFNRQRDKTIAAIDQLGADIVGVIEMENDGDSASSALADLVNGLNGANASAQWSRVSLPAGFGTIPGSTDEITTRLIYKNSKVEAVGAALACDNAAFSNGRTPLAQLFRSRTTGGSVIVSINHFKSKGSCPAAGDPNADQLDGQGCWAQARLEQAQALIACAAQWQTQAGEQRVLLLGDFNGYEQENAIDAFRAAGMSTLVNNSYSFVFDANSGALDHAIASAALVPQVTGAAKWHINADEPISLDYNVEFKSAAQQVSLYAPDPFRSSDHDPALVGMNLSPVCALDVDNNAAVEANFDALLVLRYLLGFRGDALIDAALGTGATRNATQIETHLAGLDLDFDGDAQSLATTDGLLILRTLLGLTDEALATGAVNPSVANPPSGADIRSRINTRLRYACAS